MDRERWKKIEPILDRALELPAEQRAAYLDEACGDDAELRAEIEALIAADQRTRGPLDDPTEVLGAAFEDSDPKEPALPDEIGGYTIDGKLGEGGMGVVYKATQQDPRRHVALKVLRAGMDSRIVLARFEAERHALGLMDHPCIAKVFGAGATQDGLPFFVMEYVDGEPITTYCDRKGLSTAARLDLFMSVCDAVQHAHQKGIIHRDLKPTNILVAERDGQPAPRVIDFGIAKAIDRDAAVQTAFTEHGQFVGTPEYMSPEQATSGSEDPDTRTDVYSLGVLLYELLTGFLPFEAEALRRAGFDEMRRIIRETDPPRPSTRLRTLDEERTSGIVQSRGVDARSLARQLEGELDWVVLRALEKEPGRRYGSPEAFADDVRRFLQHEPVRARPATRFYRLGKFARRHRIGVAFTTVALLGVAVFLGVVSWQATRIARERDRADAQARTATRALDFLVDVFEVSDPGEAQGKEVTAREVLERGAERVSSELQDEPEVRATLLRTIANVLMNLGLLAEARPMLEQSHELHIELFGAEHPDTLQVLHDLATLAAYQGRLAEAEEQAREVVELRRRVLGDSHRATLGSIDLLGVVLNRRGKVAEAEQHLRTAEAGLRDVLGEDHEETLITRNNLAFLLSNVGQLDEAVTHFEEIAETFARTLGENHPNTLATWSNVGATLERIGEFERAETVYRHVLDARQQVLEADHPDTLAALNNLGNLLAVQRRFDEAEGYLRDALEGRSRVLGENHPATLQAQHNMAVFFWDQGKLDQSEDLLRQALAGRRVHLGEGHKSTISSQRMLGLLMNDRGRPAEAEQLFTAGLSAAREHLGEDQFYTLLLSTDVGRLLVRQEKPGEAEPYLREALERSATALDPTDPYRARFKNYYGQCLGKLGRYEEAEPLMLEANESLRAVFPETHPAVNASARYLAELYEAWGRDDEAQRWREKS